MAASSQTHDSAGASGGQFGLTHWSVVLRAGRSESTHARAALEQLCTAYWQPIYYFIRRQGHNPTDAQDLTQEFFARLLQKNYLAAVDRSKGRFRSFLLASVKHFLANEWDKATAQKRGGGRAAVPLDTTNAETSYAVEPVERLSPDKLFERRWALTLLQQVLSRLRAEFAESGRAKLFEHLKGTLTGESRSVGYAALAQQLGTTEGAVKVAVHRLRQRYRELLRAEIAQTVAGPEEVELEIRALFSALE